MPCPCKKGFLGTMPGSRSRVKDTKGRPYIRRQRKCNACLRVFTTYEFVVEENETMVAVRDNRGVSIMTGHQWAASLKRSIEKLIGQMK